jgi:hypothetical protein
LILQVRRLAVLKLKAGIRVFGYHQGAGVGLYLHREQGVLRGVVEGCHRLVAMQELYREAPNDEKEKYRYMRGLVLQNVPSQRLSIICQREFVMQHCSTTSCPMHDMSAKHHVRNCTAGALQPGSTRGLRWQYAYKFKLCFRYLVVPPDDVMCCFHPCTLAYKSLLCSRNLVVPPDDVLYCVPPCMLADLNRLNHAVVKTTLHDEIWGIKYILSSGDATRADLKTQMDGAL